MKIFISCPLSVAKSHLDYVVEAAKLGGNTVTSWNRLRHSYDSQELINADIVVFVLPDNKWSYDIDDLPVGVKYEFKQAVRMKKQLAIAYRNQSSGTVQLYKAATNGKDTNISGIAGSYGFHILEKKFIDINGEYTDNEDEDDDDANWFDDGFLLKTAQEYLEELKAKKIQERIQEVPFEPKGFISTAKAFYKAPKVQFADMSIGKSKVFPDYDPDIRLLLLLS